MFTSETILLSSLLYLEGFLPENHFSLLKASIKQKQKGHVKRINLKKQCHCLCESFIDTVSSFPLLVRIMNHLQVC